MIARVLGVPVLQLNQGICYGKQEAVSVSYFN